MGRPEPGQELIVSGTPMFVRGAASASSGFVAAALLKDGAQVSRHYGAGKYLERFRIRKEAPGKRDIHAMSFYRGIDSGVGA